MPTLLSRWLGKQQENEQAFMGDVRDAFWRDACDRLKIKVANPMSDDDAVLMLDAWPGTPEEAEQLTSLAMQRIQRAERAVKHQELSSQAQRLKHDIHQEYVSEAERAKAFKKKMERMEQERHLAEREATGAFEDILFMQETAEEPDAAELEVQQRLTDSHKERSRLRATLKDSKERLAAAKSKLPQARTDGLTNHPYGQERGASKELRDEIDYHTRTIATTEKALAKVEKDQEATAKQIAQLADERTLDPRRFPSRLKAMAVQGA